VTILVETDLTLEQKCEDSVYVILINKDDPLSGNGLIHRAQARPGENITHDVSWNNNRELKIYYYAVRQKAEGLIIHNDLLTTRTISKDDCYTIARVTLPKPEAYAPSQVCVAAWPNPHGRTIVTALYVFKGNETSIDVNATSHNVLKKKAVCFAKTVHALDVHSTNEQTTLHVAGVGGMSVEDRRAPSVAEWETPRSQVRGTTR
jgi:hypothetical protein